MFSILTLLSLAAYLLAKRRRRMAAGASPYADRVMRLSGPLVALFAVSGGLLAADDWMDALAAPTTEYSIPGEYRFPHGLGIDGVERTGSATIAQRAGSAEVSIVGKLVDPNATSAISFRTRYGRVLDSGELFFVYENQWGILGVAHAVLEDLTPERFIVRYRDLAGPGIFNEPSGTIVFERQAAAE